MYSVPKENKKQYNKNVVGFARNILFLFIPESIQPELPSVKTFYTRTNNN